MLQQTFYWTILYKQKKHLHEQFSSGKAAGKEILLQVVHYEGKSALSRRIRLAIISIARIKFFSSEKHFFIFQIKVSWHIALSVVSRSIIKLFSCDYVNINLFSMFFSIDFAQQKSGVTPHCLYCDSLTSLQLLKGHVHLIIPVI